MKKIIPFKKQVYFNNNVEEITSISLEHTLLPIDNNEIKGDFIISGEYKMTESSISVDPFEFYIPCDIELNACYKLDKVQINIDDFYYELIDSKILEVSIDVLLDKLEEEKIINEIPIKHVSMEELESDLHEDREEIEEENESIEDNIEITKEEDNIKEEVNDTVEEVTNKEERCIEVEDSTKSIFSNFQSSEEEYRTYKVYIVREGDSLEQIISKYQITKEELEKYNELKELSIGDKIIIPYFYEDNK